jgi:hypothetical protein
MPISRRFFPLIAFILIFCLFSPQKSIAQSASSITLLSPGEDSLVTSPIFVTAEVYPGADKLIRVTLIDQQNNLLARQLLHVTPSEGNPIQFNTDLAFEIAGESTQALLTISTQDKHHRPKSLRSVVLNLQTDDPAKIQPYNFTDHWLTITEPPSLATRSGGQFLVSGRIVPPNNNPVMFDLMTESGGVVGTSQLDVQTPGEAFDFEVLLSYDFITEAHEVRLIIRQRLNEFSSDAILDSMPIVLLP